MAWDLGINKLMPWQRSVFRAAMDIDSPIRNIVVIAGRRTGKTTLARILLHTKALQYPCDIAVVYPQLKQGRDVLLGDYLKDVAAHPEFFKSIYTNSLEFRYMNGSYLKYYSMKEINAIRGKKLAMLIVDESQQLTDLEKFESACNPALASTKNFETNLFSNPAKAIYFGTGTKGYNQPFYQLIQRGAAKDQFESWKTYVVKFNPKNATHVKEEEYLRIKAQEPAQVWDREYQCDCSSRQGLIYDEFSRDVHVIKHYPPGGIMQAVLGIDFGYAHPTAIVVACKSANGKWYITDEFKKSGVLVTSDGLVPIVQQFIKQYHVSKIYCSPEANQEREQLRRLINNAQVSPALGHQVLDGIAHIRSLFHHDLQNTVMQVRPELYVLEKCVELIKEMESYTYQSNEEAPIKINNDAVDALRYCIYSATKAINTRPAGHGVRAY